MQNTLQQHNLKVIVKQLKISYEKINTAILFEDLNLEEVKPK